MLIGVVFLIFIVVVAFFGFICLLCLFLGASFSSIVMLLHQTPLGFLCTCLVVEQSFSPVLVLAMLGRHMHLGPFAPAEVLSGLCK